MNYCVAWPTSGTNTNMADVIYERERVSIIPLHEGCDISVTSGHITAWLVLMIGDSSSSAAFRKILYFTLGTCYETRKEWQTLCPTQWQKKTNINWNRFSRAFWIKLPATHRRSWRNDRLESFSVCLPSLWNISVRTWRLQSLNDKKK